MEEFEPDQVLCWELASELRGELTETCHMVQAAMWACALQKPMGLIWTILSCVANYGHTSKHKVGIAAFRKKSESWIVIAHLKLGIPNMGIRVTRQ